jgi:hypothetical protein
MENINEKFKIVIFKKGLEPVNLPFFGVKKSKTLIVSLYGMV